MKKLTKIWGIGLALVLAASLLFGAVPASAGDLSWGTESVPSTTDYVITASTAYNVADFSVADDGTIYMVTGGSDNACFKSTNGGVTWSKLPKDFLVPLTKVAVAPDDSSIVAVGENTGTPNFWVSTDGGSSFGDLGNAAETGVDTLASTGLSDLVISYADGSKHYIGVAGISSGNDTSKAGVFYFDLGAAAPKWNATILDGGFKNGQDASYAVAFSPNVASDKVMVAVSSNTSASGNVYFQIYSLSTKVWNGEAAFSGYPVNIQNNSTDIESSDGGAIALAPDYLGSDDSLRIAFVGIQTGTTAEAGIYRLKDTSVKDFFDGSGYEIYSIAFDGTNLIAGNAINNKVYRSDDPLASSPSFSTTSEQKRPGKSGVTSTIVAWNGADVVAGTSGTGSAFSVSKDNGKSFNDISFIDTAAGTLGTMLDVAVSADGSKFYMLTDDSSTLSLWRNAGSWQRVLAVSSFAGNDGIVRLAPDDANAVYVADEGAKTIYYSAEGGNTKWFIRTSANNIGDLALESADVGYVAVDSAKTVSKTTNSGFTWGTAKDTGVGGTSIDMIASLGKDKLIVGSDGYVAWSKDGNSSWSKVNTGLNTQGLTQVTASGLADGDYIYAATATSGSRVERWQIGQSGTSWKNLEAPMTGRSAKGIALVSGVLYVQTTEATNSVTLRTLSPTDGEPSSGMWSTMSTAAAAFSATPQSLKTSTGSTKLWSVSGNTSAIYSYTDTIATVGITLSAPADGFAVTVNPVSGGTYTVALSWTRLSKSTIYDYQVALDSGFVEKVINTSTSSTTSSSPSVVISGDNFMPGTKYYWRVRTNIAGPIRSQWSETRSFTVAELPEAQPPVVIEQTPPPVIQVPTTVPEIKVEVPEIKIPAQPAPIVNVPAAPAPTPAVPSWAIYAIIIIGAVLVIALIVLIMRTRRPV